MMTLHDVAHAVAGPLLGASPVMQGSSVNSPGPDDGPQVLVLVALARQVVLAAGLAL